MEELHPYESLGNPPKMIPSKWVFVSPFKRGTFETHWTAPSSKWICTANLFSKFCQVWHHNSALHATNIRYIYICFWLMHVKKTLHTSNPVLVYAKRQQKNIMESCTNHASHGTSSTFKTSSRHPTKGLNLRRGELQQSAHVSGWRDVNRHEKVSSWHDKKVKLISFTNAKITMVLVGL